MASLQKVLITRPLPAGAELVTHKGKRCFRALKSGRRIYLPLTDCGTRYKEESRKWYIKYRDANGITRRVPGYADKDATLQKAAELEREAAHIQSGLSDPHEDGKLQPLKDHLEQFRAFLKGTSNSTKHVRQTCTRIDRLVKGCGFVRWTDIVPSVIVTWLGDEREAGRIGIKTSNYYLAAIKQFCTWLEDDGKVPKSKNPIEHLSAINADTDIRRQRRAISADEFSRLVRAAATGPSVQCVSGPDRAMLYVLAAWTGYRREELASLTIKSLALKSSPPTVSVQAGYSKRRKNDVLPLHPAVVEQLQVWMKTKGLTDPNRLLFDLRTSGGNLRATSKMMQSDWKRARAGWIYEAKDDAAEVKRRQDSDYLKYQDEQGTYADFHSNRHTFITNLSLAGVHPKTTQNAARHSDMNLTMGIYTHTDLATQFDAIKTLAAPPAFGVSPSIDRPRRIDQPDGGPESVVPIVVPTFGFECLCMSSGVTADGGLGADERKQKPLPEQGLVDICHWLTSDVESSGGGTRTPDTRIMIPLL